MPTCLLTVKPNLAPQTDELAFSSTRRLASSTNAGVAKRAPLRMRRNSERRFRVARRGACGRGGCSCAVAMPSSVAGFKPRGACGPSRAGARESGGRRQFPCACGSHGAACERPCSADKCASRLVSAFKPGPEPFESTAARCAGNARGGLPTILPDLLGLIGLPPFQVNPSRPAGKRSLLLAQPHVCLTAVQNRKAKPYSRWPGLARPIFGATAFRHAGAG
jgi:hypothetical protein